MTAAKLQAARDLGVRVIVVQRPPLPAGASVVATVAEAAAWIGGGADQPG
jgi:precorrin-6A/cobalt-precorrin-6A reductase